MARIDASVRLTLTDAGKMLLLGTVFFFLTAAVIPAFGVLTALLSVLLTALLVGFILRPRVLVTGNLPESIVVGHSIQLRYSLENAARVPAYDLHLRFEMLPDEIEQIGQDAVVSRLAPGETVDASITIRPRRRGYYKIPAPICQSSFPFNLMSFGRRHRGEQALTVLPVFYRLQCPLRRLSRHVRTGGAGFAGRAEVSPEYAGNRPFLPGDSPRRIDTRAWARLSVPATKEYHNDSDSRAALVLDSRVPARLRPANDGEVPALEAAVSLAASILYSVNQSCLVDLLLAGPQLHEYTSWLRGARLNSMHEVLAGVRDSRGAKLDRAVSGLADRLYGISEAIFILLDWDETYNRLLESAARAGCHTTVLLIDAPAGRSHGTDEVNWADAVKTLSSDDILTGRIERL
jgi:uncharacterized protein (DUF58 family)